jgi:hypothetical protein
VTVARDPNSAQRWLAAVEQGGLLASEDDGQTWRQCSPLWDTHVVAFLPEGAIVAATAGGLQVSADDARSWQSAKQPRGYGTGLSIDVDGIVYAVVKGADHGPIWYSKNAGRTWEPAPGGAALPHPDFGVHALAADPLIASTLYYGAGDAVWLIRGRSATKIAEGLPPIRRVLVLTTSPKRERPSSGKSESSMKALQAVRHISVSINRPVAAECAVPTELQRKAGYFQAAIKLDTARMISLFSITSCDEQNWEAQVLWQLMAHDKKFMKPF